MYRTTFMKICQSWTALCLIALTACGGSGSPASGPPTTLADTTTASANLTCGADCGTVLMGLTDADGDFLSYLINVVTISLTRTDGLEVETLPLSTRVDFAQYTELTEFLSAATVPPGTYESIRLTLDYTDAEIVVERDGAATDAVAVDASGAALQIEELTIALAASDRLVIAPGLPSLLIVDFDLAASHELDLTQTPVTAIAEPFLYADIDPVATKEMRVRGPLVSVSPDLGAYTVALRPFWHWRGDFGPVRVFTSDQTAFEIDGVSYDGVSGIALLATLPPATPTLAFGNLDVDSRHYSAKEVYVGSSVPGHNADIVTGVVTGRVDDTLTVRGVTLVRTQDSAHFLRSADVLVGADTQVSKAGVPGFAGDAAALSVGQRITAFGQLGGSTTAPVLDASAGRVRMTRSIVTGIARTVGEQQLNMEVREIAGRSISLFDFSGTGTPGSDANPDDYEIATGNLDLDDLSILSPVKVAGFVSPFGLAPPDFSAVTVADYSAVRATLGLSWMPATMTGFLTLNSDGIVLDLDHPDIGRRHWIRRYGINADLLEYSSATLVPASAESGLYAIRQDRAISIYRNFADFSGAIARRLGAGGAARSVTAHGHWSENDFELQSTRIVVKID